MSYINLIMQKILVVHNKYQKRGGEDIAVENEIKLLSKNYEVKVLYFNNFVENYFKQLIYFIINRNLESQKKLKKEIELFKPNVVYVHNTWFKASVGIFSILKKYKINTVVKLHNFRYCCTKSYLSKNHFENLEFCEKCGSSKKNNQLFSKYFSDSYMKSFLINYYGKKYFNILKNHNIKICVLTKYHQQHLLKLGFNKSKIHVVPNYLEVGKRSLENPVKNNAIYAGRVSKEKGVKELIETFLTSDLNGMTLSIIGDGPELNNYRNIYKNPKIKFYGELPNEEVLTLISNAKFVVTATKLWRDNQLFCAKHQLTEHRQYFLKQEV